MSAYDPDSTWKAVSHEGRFLAVFAVVGMHFAAMRFTIER
jgi:hypothetical protein